MKKYLLLALALLAASLTTATAAETSWPTRPVKLIVAFAPGGPTDIFARLIGQKLAESTGQNFYVENLRGAGGNIGTGRAAQSAPDGYTVLITGGNLTNNPFLFDHVPFDPLKDFAAVTLGAMTPVVLGVLFQHALKLDLVHVPFEGGGNAVLATVAGHTPISFGAAAPAVALIKDGKLRALAVTGKARSPTLPEIPTMAEAGFPEVEGATWTAVVVPAGTPKDIVVELHRMIVG